MTHPRLTRAAWHAVYSKKEGSVDFTGAVMTFMSLLISRMVRDRVSVLPPMRMISD